MKYYSVIKAHGIIIVIAFLFVGIEVHAQYLSNLHATKNDPIYTTYAAPMERSDYRLDQAYQLMWFDPEESVGIKSEQGGSIGIAIEKGGILRSRLEEFYTEPVITTSYSDYIQLHFYPFRYLRVEYTICIYSSDAVIFDIHFTNEDNKPVKLEVYPWFHSLKEALKDVRIIDDCIIFDNRYNKDSWMTNHQIPIFEERKSCLTLLPVQQDVILISDMEDISKISDQHISDNPDTSTHVIILKSNMELRPREKKVLRLIRTLDNTESQNDDIITKNHGLQNIDLQNILFDDEHYFSQIPNLNVRNKDYKALYYNAFTLIRQCMMPPEGECNYNYYIFSREPKWGWGYGGQVFHESLVMLAYAYFDPVSAINSQRVFMERQHDNGYINYRTGPYLNEDIPYDDQLTSSAPWFNYQNLEIYRITGDMEFLEEAYESGRKYYEYYTSNRDTDDDGLCEWGAHAVLECVRDARVATWDRVGWPSNFEGPDINAMLVMEAKALSEMAGILGKTRESNMFKKDAEARTKLVNKYLWDEKTGFYYNIDKSTQDFSFKTNNDLKIKEIIGFLPMWAGIASDKQAGILMESLTNPEEFWRPYGIPTLTAADEYYNPIGYWNGPVWIQWQYLVFRGLLDYGYTAEAKVLANKVFSNVIYHLKKDHTFWEFYSADDLQAGWNKTYIWTGIVARMLIDYAEL